MDAIHHSLTRLQVQMRRERNASSPVHKLPNELLIQFISLAIDKDSLSPWMKRYRALHRLISVSHTWREVIENTPSLWSVIDFTDPTSVVRKAIQNSKNNSLHVSAFLMADIRLGRLSPEEFVQEMRPHFLRWRFAHINVKMEAAGLRELLESSSPLLERLELLSGASTTATLQDLDLSADKTRRLQHISLQNASIREWSSSLFPGLRSLVIYEPSKQPTLRQLLDMIQACHQLEVLRLEGFAGDEAAIACSRPTIPLPLLKKLECREQSQGRLRTIVGHINAPVCTELKLDLWYPYETMAIPKPFLFPDSFNHYYTPLIRRLIEAQEVYLCVGESRVIFGEAPQTRYGYPDTYHPCFVISLLHLLPLEPLKWITTAFLPVMESRQITLKIMYDFDFHKQQQLLPILWSLPNVTKLCVSYTVHNVNTLLHRLSAEKPWTFPNLRYLRIQTRDFNHGLALRMVEGRYGKVVTSEDTSESALVLPLPDAFDVLVLRDMDEWIFAEVAAVVGPALVKKVQISDDEDDTDVSEFASDDMSDGSGAGNGADEGEDGLGEEDEDGDGSFPQSDEDSAVVEHDDSVQMAM